jgi:hypothetical protein
VTVRACSGCAFCARADGALVIPHGYTADITADELRQIAQVLKTLESRLQGLYKKVSESSFKDHAAVFENLRWDILKETSYMSWFGLAFTLAGLPKLPLPSRGEVCSGGRNGQACDPSPT